MRGFTVTHHGRQLLFTKIIVHLFSIGAVTLVVGCKQPETDTKIDGQRRPGATPAQWRIGDTALVELGGPGDTISDVDDISSVTRFSNGNIAVATGNQIRIFDSAGALVR